jgi:medium-chain acyl-[acyl-carrier-protein] hydrolase
LFRLWSDELPASIEIHAVQLPGREARLREPLVTALPALAEQVAEALLPVLTGPCAFFGHSLGGLLAFEVARVLRRRGARQPVHLLVAARAAPQLARDQPTLHTLPSEELVAEVVRRYDGIPAAVRQEPALLQLLLPVLRADLQLLESYEYAEGEPLECPLSVFGGQQDGTVQPAQLEAWGAQTLGAFRLRMLPGNHFFLNTSRMALLQGIVEDLRVQL